MDRNCVSRYLVGVYSVALRKESVDRNAVTETIEVEKLVSLSARRAWIEILFRLTLSARLLVALRKESVDRNKMPVPA